MSNIHHTADRRRLRIAALERRVGFERTTIWRRCKAGTFPAPHYIGNRRAWFEDDIAEWERAEMARPADERLGAKNLADPRGA
jgi:predicted DNA-binding transcriptional regulator AlpA